MYEMISREELERLERTVHRVFARVSVLEARVNELERELEAAQQKRYEVEPRRLVEVLGRTA